MEYLFIYLLQIANIYPVIASLAFIGSFFTWVTCCINKGDGSLSFEKEVIKIPLILLSIGIITLFLPSKQTILLMGGTYLGKKAVKTVITNDKIQKIDTIINLQLDRYIKDLQTESKEN